MGTRYLLGKRRKLEELGDGPSSPSKRIRGESEDPDRGRGGESATKLESLPTEILCQVLSFIGPTSQSLIALSESSKYFHRTMAKIGKSMLKRAKVHFRVPLQPHSGESTTSLFIRHTRTCERVQHDLTHLRSLLDKPANAVQAEEVQAGLQMALRLIEMGPTLSECLERQILSTCGKCGGKAFKFSKWVLLHRFSSSLEDTADTQTRQRELYAQNQQRLDVARLVMQLVVLREFQLSKTSSSPSSIKIFVERHCDAKQMGIAGCF